MTQIPLLPPPVDPGSKPLRKRAGKDPEQFVNDLLAGVDLYAAYERAGYSRPKGNAQRLEREPKVAARIDYLRKSIDAAREMMLAIRRERTRAVLESYRDVDRTEMYYPSGALKPLDELTPEQRQLIEGIERTKFGTKVTMPSKLAALAQLAKLDGLDAPDRLAMTDPSGEHAAPVVVAPIINLFGRPESQSAS